MGFEDIPENREQSFPCPQCDGDVTKNKNGDWECSKCDFCKPEATGDF